MILIFDLDDTLYDEARFVDSGFRAVADYGHERWGLDAIMSLQMLRMILSHEGRGKVFDHWLGQQGLFSRRHVDDCVRVYRHHRPRIDLFPEARRVLEYYRYNVALYLVTDGHKIVQRNKIDALGLWSVFKRVFITHRFGIAAAKPSTYCFKRICEAEGCDWSRIVYVGDNPTKDFVGLKPLGARTVRVLTGTHSQVKATTDNDAEVTIRTLDMLPNVLSIWFPSLTDGASCGNLNAP